MCYGYAIVTLGKYCTCDDNGFMLLVPSISLSQKMGKSETISKSPPHMGEQWMLQPVFSSLPLKPFSKDVMDDSDYEEASKLLNNPPMFIGQSSFPLTVGAQSAVARSRVHRLASLAGKYLPKYPQIGLLLAESHFLLQDPCGAYEWCTKVRDIADSDDAGLSNAIDNLQSLIVPEDDDDEEEPEERYTVFPYTRPQPFNEYGSPIALSSESMAKFEALKNQNRGIMDEFARLACISTNEIEGVFALTGNSIPALVKSNFLENSIAGISGKSRVKNKAKVIKILENTMECFSMLSGSESVLNVDEDLVKDLHRTLLQDDFVMDETNGGEVLFYIISRGKYRIGPCFTTRDIDMKEVRFCPAPMIAVEIAWFFNQAQAILSSPTICPYMAAAWLQWAFLKIHPFGDGNGRVSRMMSSIPLLRCHLPPIVVTLEHKQAYFAAIKEADITGNVVKLAEFFRDELASAIDALHELHALSTSRRDLRSANIAGLTGYMQNMDIWQRSDSGDPV